MQKVDRIRNQKHIGSYEEALKETRCRNAHVCKEWRTGERPGYGLFKEEVGRFRWCRNKKISHVLKWRRRRSYQFLMFNSLRRKEKTDFFWVCHWLDYFTSFKYSHYYVVKLGAVRRTAPTRVTQQTELLFSECFRQEGYKLPCQYVIFSQFVREGNLIFTRVCIFVIFYDDWADWKWNLESRGKASQREKFLSCFRAVRQIDICSLLFPSLSRYFFLFLYISLFQYIAHC